MVREEITKRIKHLTIGNRTITLNEDETLGQALERVKNPTPDAGSSEVEKEANVKVAEVEGTK